MPIIRPQFPVHLRPTTTRQYDAAATAEVAECDLDLDDREALETLHAILAGEPFIVQDQWMIAVSGFEHGTISVISCDRVDGKVEMRRWQLSVAQIYALLCEDAIAFPPRPGTSASKGSADRNANRAA